MYTATHLLRVSVWQSAGQCKVSVFSHDQGDTAVGTSDGEPEVRGRSLTNNPMIEGSQQENAAQIVRATSSSVMTSI